MSEEYVMNLKKACADHAAGRDALIMRDFLYIKEVVGK